MNFWIGVASKEHVIVGKEGGFCQLCHGKERPLERMKRGDWIIYYSSKESMQNKEPYQKFTAIGQVIRDEVYQFEMSANFVPFRRDVNFLPSIDAEIRPLIDMLSFITDKRRWGYPFRYGHLQIDVDDFLLIASKMINVHILDQIKMDIITKEK